MGKPTLLVVGEMCLPQNEVARDWDVLNGQVTTSHEIDGMFVAYNQSPSTHFVAKVYGTNMSRPTWAISDGQGGWKLPISHLFRDTGAEVVTTRDIPRDILNGVTPTAEHAIGLMMALHRNLVPASREPLADRSKFLAPKMLSRMSAGILGAGRIGNLVWRKLEPLMLATYAYDPVLFPAASLEQVVRKSDVLFLCCPSSPFGHPMGTAEFAQMPEDAIIINIAQPDLIDWPAAFDALAGGRIRGIAADVFPAWVAVDGQEFSLMGKLLLTPHIAGSTLDARRITEKAVLDVMRSKL